MAPAACPQLDHWCVDYFLVNIRSCGIPSFIIWFPLGSRRLGLFSWSARWLRRSSWEDRILCLLVKFVEIGVLPVVDISKLVVSRLVACSLSWLVIVHNFAMVVIIVSGPLSQTFEGLLAPSWTYIGKNLWYCRLTCFWSLRNCWKNIESSLS